MSPILALDLAKITDKVERYTGVQFAEFVIHEAKRGRKKIAVIEIGISGRCANRVYQAGRTYIE